jgi:hypothetical protein
MLCNNIFQKNTMLVSLKRAKDKAASENKKAQLKLNYQKKKSEKQSGSGEIIPDDPPAPVVFAAAVPIVAAPAFVPAAFRFKLGDCVETPPVSGPGVRAYLGESFVGTVAALDYTTRLVTIKSCFGGHICPAVHEEFVEHVTRAINGIDFRFTRAAAANPNVHFQRELDKKDRKNCKQGIQIAGLQARVDYSAETKAVAKALIIQLRKELTLLRGEIEELRESNSIFIAEILDLDSSFTSAREIFSRNGPSSNATPVIKAIRSISNLFGQAVGRRSTRSVEYKVRIFNSVFYIVLRHHDLLWWIKFCRFLREL